jgi:transposase
MTVAAGADEHVGCHEVLLTRRDRLDRLIAEQATAGPWAALIARMRCLRGIDTLTAIGLLTEISDFTAFTHPRRLASFVGLVPSESCSGDRRRQGSITKCGSEMDARVKGGR